MGYITHNQSESVCNEAGGVGFVNAINADYKELIALFGEPTVGDPDKTDACWYVRFDDGTIATIYNWKNGKNYKGSSGLAVEQIRDWHIGGAGQASYEKVQIALDLYREKREAEKPQHPIEQAFESAFEIMDSLRATRGENFANVVEGGIIIRKQTELFALLLSVIEDAELVPDAALKMLKHISTEMSARTLSKLAKVSGVVEEGKGSESAEDIMTWVERVIQAEQSGAHTLMETLKKGAAE